VKKICENCKEEIEVSEEMYRQIKEELAGIPEKELAKYEVDLSQKVKLYHGKGCADCNNLGFKGRIAIYEVIEISDKIKDLITDKRGSEGEFEIQAKKEGMISIRQDGILKALGGITEMSEIDRVTKGNLNAEEEVEIV
jgi:type IV pilus assembly protein PilB